MKDAGPAEDMPAAGDLCCCGWVQTDWAGGHLMAADSLKWHMRRTAQVTDLGIIL